MKLAKMNNSSFLSQSFFFSTIKVKIPTGKINLRVRIVKRKKQTEYKLAVISSAASTKSFLGRIILTHFFSQNNKAENAIFRNSH